MFEFFLLCIVCLVAFKLYRFWMVDKLVYWHSDDTIFNKKVLDISSTYEPGTIPPPYPNLWYPVLQSRRLKPGQVKPLYVFEKNLVIYRASSGKAHVLDAFCPHLGAHLGVGGSVVGEDICCPFHNWTFNGRGVCTSVFGLKASNNVISKAKTKSWKCIEKNDWIYVWYHQNEQAPTWTPPSFNELKLCRHTGEAEDIQHGHLVDILSNTADIAHFEGIHTMSGIVSPWQVLRKGKLYYIARKIFRFDYQAQWENGVGHDSHIAFMEAKITPVLFGFEINMLQTITRTKICPPVLYITTKMSKFKQIGFYLISVLTPMSLMKNLFTHNIYHGPGFFSKLLARIGLYSVVILIEPDKIIYNNKKFLNNPCFTSLDKEQVKFFKWFKEKFYN